MDKDFDEKFKQVMQDLIRNYDSAKTSSHMLFDNIVSALVNNINSIKNEYDRIFDENKTLKAAKEKAEADLKRLQSDYNKVVSELRQYEKGSLPDKSGTK